MPYYDYKCPSCHRTEQVFHSITKDPVIECLCGDFLIKAITAPAGIHFKGSGFYATDYQNKDKK